MRLVILFICSLWMNGLLAADRDILFYNNALNEVEEKCLYHTFNLFSNAIGHGLVENGSRTGLGNKNPVGITLQAPSLYYQSMHIFSQTDQELIRQIYHDNLGCFPPQLTFQYGAFSETFIESLSLNQKPLISKINRTLGLLFPDLPVLKIHNLADHFFNNTLLTQTRAGINNRLAFLRKAYTSNQQGDVIAHIRAIASAYSPLSFRLSINFPEQLQQGKINASILMPALHEFLYTDFEDANSWYLQKGFKKTPLSTPIKISLANITHMSYLENADLSKKQVIKMTISKSFMEANKLTAEMSFGRLNETSNESKIDSTFPEDAFVIYLNMREQGYILQANIHKLSLQFSRETVGTTNSGDFDDARLRPQLLINDSLITFRLHKKVFDTQKYQNLLGNGFQCKSTNDIHWDCWRDYTWENLPTSLFGMGIEAVVNLNMQHIENALDNILSEIIDDISEELNIPSNILSQRFRAELFR